MNTDMILRIDSTSSDITERFAAEMGRRLRGGEVIVLSSDLGGGKTTFVRGLARGMGSADHVASPTFTISREYRADKLTLYHLDFYRLSEPGIIAAELEEFLHDDTAVVAIEWGDVVSKILPSDRVTIQINRTGETTRSLRLSAPASRIYLFQETAA